jgi:hypothetical protein
MNADLKTTNRFPLEMKRLTIRQVNALLIIVSWLAFLGLWIASLGGYRDAAALSSVVPPPIPSLLFLGGILNVLATSVHFCHLETRGGRWIRGSVMGIMAIFWLITYAMLAYFILCLTGTLVRRK